MVLISVLCPHRHSDHVIKGGKTKAGQQRYKCQNTDCPHYSFQLDLLYKGRAPALKEQIVDMSLNVVKHGQNINYMDAEIIGSYFEKMLQTSRRLV